MTQHEIQAQIDALEKLKKTIDKGIVIAKEMYDAARERAALFQEQMSDYQRDLDAVVYCVGRMKHLMKSQAVQEVIAEKK